jgi:SEC-C motif-containing protein
VLLPSFFLLFLLSLSDDVEAFAAANKKNNSNKKKGTKKKTGNNANANANANASFSGFGTPPETYNDVIKGFKTRLPTADTDDLNSKLPCPCNGGNGGTTGTDTDNDKTFNECCGPLIAASTAAAAAAAAAASSQDDDSDGIGVGVAGGCLTPREVLQSRYTSFYYRDVNHIIQTTHEVCRDYNPDNNRIVWAKELNKNGMFDSFEFIGLDIINEDIESDNEAYLDFTVRLRGRTIDDSPKRTEQSSLSSIEGEETVVSEKSKFIKDPVTKIWKYAGGDVRSNVKGLDDITLNA